MPEDKSRPADRERMPVEERRKPVSPPQQPKPATPDQPKAEPPRPAPDRQPRAEGLGRNPAVPVVEPRAEGQPRLIHRDVDDPIITGDATDDPVRAERIAHEQANFKPEAGVDWDDPEFVAAQQSWAEEIERLSRQRPDSQPGQPKAADLPERKVAPPIKVVRPETLDQQTMQADDASNYPGTGAPGAPKVQVVATDPSVIQVMRPAGEEAQGNVDLQEYAKSLPGLSDLVQKLVQAELAKGKSTPQPGPSSPVYQVDPTQPKWKPDAYLVHYRNDVFPQKRYIRMHVDHEKDELFQDRIDLGEFILFQNGHFFATDQRDVDQLEWMRTHPTHDRVGTVVGGDPSLYVDDDSSDVLWCPECARNGVQKPFASATKLKAHRKATHNVAA